MSQVKIQGNASGTGIFTVAAPNSNTDRTLTLPDGAGTLDRLERAGNILQVVQATRSTWTTTTSTSMVTTGLTASITPSNTANKILILVSMNGCFNDSSTNNLSFELYKNGGSISYLDDGLSYGVGNLNSSSSYQYFDSPATTSSTTYAIYFRSRTGATIGVNNYITGANRTLSSIILMEIAQ